MRYAQINKGNFDRIAMIFFENDEKVAHVRVLRFPYAMMMTMAAIHQTVNEAKLHFLRELEEVYGLQY